MKKFEVPMMSIQKLDSENIIRTSGNCFETFACTECYCELVQCGGTYECTGLRCNTLSDYD